MLLHVIGFGGCFQFSQMDGSLPDPTLETVPGITSEIQYRQVVTGTILPGLVCRCVPPGSCPVAPTVAPPVLPADGSGQIDIRIVNNVSVSGVGVFVNLTVFSSWFQQLHQQWLLLRLLIHVYMV